MDGFLSDLFLSPLGFNGVLMFLKLFCTILLIQFILNFKDQYQYFKSSPSRIYGKPIKVFGRIQIPELDEKQFLFFGFSLILSLIFIIVGWYTRFFIFTALVSYFFYFNSIISLAYIQRKTNLIPIVLFILLISPSINKSIYQPTSSLELMLVKIALIQIYLSAGLQKLNQNGLSWCNGSALQAYLLENYLWSDNKNALYLSNKKMLCALLSTGTLIFELTFWLVIFFPFLWVFYVFFALLFHLGTLITMRINYLKYILPVYMVFFVEIGFYVFNKIM